MKNIKGYGSFLADPIKDVEVVNPKTVRVVLTGPNASFLAALAANVFAIMDARTVRAQGGVETPGADTQDKAEQWFHANSAGAAPYVLRRYTRESEIVFERNDKYYGEKPFFRQVIIKHVKDKATQSLMVQRGDADVALDLTVDQVEALRGKPDINIHQALSLNTVYFGLNTAIKPFDNPKVREAVKYAIDYEGIQKGLMNGGGKLVATPVAVGVMGMTDALNTSMRYKEDLNKARALLKEAGVTGARAKLMYEAGASHGTLSNDRLAQKLRADLGRVGITLDLQPLASSIFLTTYREKKEETVIGTWNPDLIDADNWAYFVNGFINARVHWEHPDGKRLVETALRTSAPDKRAEVTEQYYRVLAEPGTPFVAWSSGRSASGPRQHRQLQLPPAVLLRDRPGPAEVAEPGSADGCRPGAERDASGRGRPVLAVTLFALRRLLLAIPTLVGITLVTFLIAHTLPENLVLVNLGESGRPRIRRWWRPSSGSGASIVSCPPRVPLTYVSNLGWEILGVSIMSSRPCVEDSSRCCCHDRAVGDGDAAGDPARHPPGVSQRRGDAPLLDVVDPGVSSSVWWCRPSAGDPDARSLRFQRLGEGTGPAGRGDPPPPTVTGRTRGCPPGRRPGGVRERPRGLCRRRWSWRWCGAAFDARITRERMIQASGKTMSAPPGPRSSPDAW